MQEKLVLDSIDSDILGQLSPRSASKCAGVCKSWAQSLVEIIDAAYEARFEAVMPCLVARKHVVRLLGCPAKSAKMALEWRWLATKRAQKLEMLQGFSDRSIGAARLEGGDVFAACKRAVLFSEDFLPSSIQALGEVEHWMQHVVEAVDSGRFEESMPAWRWFVEHELLKDGSVRWLVELAHYLDSMRTIICLVCEFPSLREQIEGYASALAAHPNLGQYTHDRGRIRDRDIRRLLKAIDQEAN